MKRAPHLLNDDAPIKDVRKRAFEFAVRIVRLCRHLERSTQVSRSLTSQLLRAGTSVGANLEEAQAAQSRNDFIHKNSISLKEIREAKYWLRLIIVTEALDIPTALGIQELIEESTELGNIIGKIIVTAKNK